ncbi:MAG: hypothetical protein INR70_23265 [Parafilimonas terrae]|jgi:DNA-binding MarR family transcriptional regulator|nr:hypothetical protein [Parafilimonas terrae]
MATGVTAQEILAHPRFAEARAAHVDAVVALFKADPLALRMMADAGIIILRGFIVGFHFAFDPEDRATWGTPGNIRGRLVERGLASPRHVDDLLARFRHAGYVEAAPAPGDRRIVILTPTARVIAHDRRHLAAYHRFLLALYPGRGYEWALTQDEDIHRRIRLSGLRDLPRALSVLGHEALRLFLGRDAGYLALLLVIQANLSGRDDLTWTSMSNDLGVARSHLRTLFSEAERAGYVDLHGGRGGPVAILPPLWAAYDRFLAEIEADQDTIAQAAFART